MSRFPRATDAYAIPNRTVRTLSNGRCVVINREVKSPEFGWRDRALEALEDTFGFENAYEVTAAEFARILGCSYATAVGRWRVLKQQGLIR